MTSEHPTPPAPSRQDTFATTRWTVVLAAGRSSTPQAKQALEELCRSYWYPLYAYVRRRGYAHEDAEDLTQGFFARFLERNYLDGVTSEKGLFRSFLLASLKHFLANEWDRATCQKRGGEAAVLSLDWESADDRYKINFPDDLSPDKIYDREWALALLERVMKRLREACSGLDQRSLFDHLAPFLTLDKAKAPYQQAAAELDMTEGAVRVAVHRLRKRYRDLLREEITQTLSDPGQVEEEMRALLGAFN